MFNINDKIKVFISSESKKKEYKVLREAIKIILEKTGFIKTYVFEDEGASTLGAEDHFLNNIDDCDVVLFLIDNNLKDGAVPTGVQKEILRVNYLNEKYPTKKAFYIFYNLRNKKITNIQSAIISKGTPKFDVVTEFKEFIKNSFDSITNNIFYIYKLYCRGQLVKSDDYNQQKEESSIININQEHFISSDVDKQYLKQFIKSKDLIWNTIFKEKVLKESDNFIDEFTYILIKHLIGKVTFFEIDLEKFKSDLKKEKINSFNLKRWEAIEAYYNDNLELAIRILYQLYNKDLNDVPEWIKNDILIDIRYIENINFRKNNQLGIPAAQSKLDSSNAFLAFPVIDRLGYDIYDQILNEIFEITVQPLGSFRWSNVLKEIFEKIEKYVFVSVYYGSLVHILLSRQLLMKATFHFSQLYSDQWLKYLCMEMAVLNGEPVKIKKILSNFISYFNVSSYEKVNSLYSLTNMLPIKLMRDEVKLTVLQIIGYYLSDEDYLKCEDEVFKIADSWAKDEKRIVSIGFPLIELMEKSIVRINANKVLEFALVVLEKKLLRFFDDVFRALVYLDWNSADNVLKEKLITEIEDLIKNEELRKKFSDLGSLIISMRKNCIEHTKHWDGLIQKEWIDLYKNIYDLEIIDLTQDTATTYIIKYTNQIKERNKTQGKNGKYFGYGDNPQKIIINIINDVRTKEIDFSYINKELLPVLLKVLYNKHQTTDEKTFCFKLLMNLESKCLANNFSYDWNSFSNRIFKYRSKILLANKITDFKIYSLSILKLYAFFYEVINGYRNEQEALSIFSELSNLDRLDSIKFIEGINDYIKYFKTINDKEIPYLLNILQIVFTKSYDGYYEIRIKSVACLGDICDTGFKDIVISRLSEMMEDSDYRVRLKVLWQLDKIRKINEQYFNHILQKAKVDNNFIIRLWLKKNLKY